MERTKHIIDAENKVLGRLASKIAVLLRGKNEPSFTPNVDAGAFVFVKNIDKIKFTGKKRDKKIYYRHTGFLGGLKSVKLKDLYEKDPAKVLRKAVYGMLPKNRLRAKQIRRLKITK